MTTAKNEFAPKVSRRRTASRRCRIAIDLPSTIELPRALNPSVVVRRAGIDAIHYRSVQRSMSIIWPHVEADHVFASSVTVAEERVVTGAEIEKRHRCSGAGVDAGIFPVTDCISIGPLRL